jgi:transcriptional regulator with XRE-family HTH domain
MGQSLPVIVRQCQAIRILCLESGFLQTRAGTLTTMSTDIEQAVSENADLVEHKVTINQLVGYNMAEYRKAARLTQDELGKRLGGWTKVAVSAAERSWDGKRIRKFDADELVTIARALGVPVVALFLLPEDAGTAKRYVLDGPGFPDLTTLLLRDILPARGGDSPPMAAYRQRLMALGVSDIESWWVRAVQALDDEAVKGWKQRLLAQLTSRPDEQTPATVAPPIDETFAIADQILAEAKAEASSLVRDAQEQHRQAMGALVLQREELERRIDDLRAFEREYRSRLVAYVEGQLRQLRWRAAAGSDVR